jgi:hypothetical protein
MANQVGQNVLYQPTANEWPTGYKQHAATITGWDEPSQAWPWCRPKTAAKLKAERRLRFRPITRPAESVPKWSPLPQKTARKRGHA